MPRCGTREGLRFAVGSLAPGMTHVMKIIGSLDEIGRRAAKPRAKDRHASTAQTVLQGIQVRIRRLEAI
jgi:hypothetical protein